MPDAFRPETLAAVLYEAARLVKKGWCRGVEAQDENGDECCPISRDAVRWSADGAVLRAAWNLHTPIVAVRKGIALVGWGEPVWDIADAAEAHASRIARRMYELIPFRGLAELNDQCGAYSALMAAVLEWAAHKAKEENQ
jgi:hypothetical protein